MGLLSLKGTFGRPTTARKLLGGHTGGGGAWNLPKKYGDSEKSRVPRVNASRMPYSIPAVRLTNDRTSGHPSVGYQVPTWLELAVAGDWPYNPISTGDMTLAEYLGTGDGDGAPTVVGGGGGGGGHISWNDEYEVPGAPDWWKGYIPSKWNAETEYVALLNSMIPFMSPEDQRTAASTLARMNIKAFKGYNPESVTFAIPPEISTPLRRDYMSADRARNMLNTLSNIVKVSGRKEKKFGPGYNYLRQIADVMADFGGTGGEEQTRTQQVQMLGALDPLLAEAKGENLSAYGGISRMISNPFFSAGQLMPVSRAQDGTYVFGRPNAKFF